MDLPDCPPGTEGYEEALTVSAPPNLDGTKAERDFQSYVHNFKLKLQDGSVRNMFERKERDAGGQWVYLCYPCGATCSGETTMQNHITGKKHKVRLEGSKVWSLSIFNEHPYYHASADKNKTRPEPTEKPYSVLDEIIYEPCALQPVLDDHKSSPLIGLEYLLELDPEEANHVPMYHCLLCNKQGQPRSIINHLNSSGHRRRFVERHYCTVHRALGPFRSYSMEKGTRAVLHTLATRVEQAHGRMKPLRTTHRHFQTHKADIFKHILDGPHISEKNGENFLEVVDADLIHFLSKCDTGADHKNKGPSPPVVDAQQPTSWQRVPATKPTAQPKVVHHGSTESLSSLSLSSPEVSPKLNNNQPKREAEIGRSAEYVKRVRQNSPQSKGYDMIKHQRFRSKLNLLERDIQRLVHESNRKFSYHEKNPEKHPFYPEEWKKFWNRRYKELQNENKDPTMFDFKPEWIVFWTKRLKELHDLDFLSQKNDVCRRLNMPLDAVDCKGVIVARAWKDGVRPLHSPERRRSQPRKSPTRRPTARRASPRRYSPRRSPARRSRYSPARARRYSPGPTRSRYHRSPPSRRAPARPPARHELRSPLHRTSRNRSAPRESSVTLISDEEMKLSENENGNLSPWGDSDSLKSVESASARRSPMSSASRRPAAGATGTGGVTSLGQEDVVSVLRVLSALEDYLGSIGSRVVDLLAQALKMEKNCPNSSEELLLEEAHCVLVDTAKEKLKGAVHAGLVPVGVTGAARDAISRTAVLLHHAEVLQKSRAEKEKADKLKAGKDGVCVAGVGAVDKAAIARQIAAALVAQGKTDVTTEELATLVDAVVGMANAKRNATSDKLTTTQDENGAKLGPTTTQSTGSALQMLCAAYDETARLELQEKPKRDEKRNNRDEERNDRDEKGSDKKDQERVEQPKEMEDRSSMDGLSDSDLKTLLQNFKDLSSDEQHDLIGYLRKLESRDSARVERLRQFVNLQPTAAVAPVPHTTVSVPHTTASVSHTTITVPHITATVPHITASVPHTTAIDSDDDDYTVDEVFKSAALKVKENQMQQDMEVVQKSLQQVQPVEDATKVLASLLSSLAPPATPHVQGTPTAAFGEHAAEPLHQPLEPADRNHFQGNAPNTRNNFQDEAPSYHLNRQMEQPAPMDTGGFPRREDTEQVVLNQPELMHRPPVFQQHAQVESAQWADSLDRTYDERPFAQETGDSLNQHYNEYASRNNAFAQETGDTSNQRYNEYASRNNVLPNMYAAEGWGGGRQVRARGGGGRGGGGRGGGGRSAGNRGGGGGQRSKRGRGQWNQSRRGGNFSNYN